jgi:release factor glutamine methyltransferase
MPEVKENEPVLALDGLEDGLHFYRILAKEAKNYLKDNGYLYLEIGYNQGEAVRYLLEAEGFRDVIVKKDLAGLDRVVIGRKA